jgi:hypothetical protein
LPCKNCAVLGRIGEVRLDLGRLFDQPVQITKSTVPCRTHQQNLLNL